MIIEIFLGDGILNLPWWGYILFGLVVTHITIASVTLFLHREQAHRSVIFHPIASHFMRFWLWLTTGMVTKEWVAIHRKHHNVVESEHDPHSPRHRGLLNVLFKGTELYRAESKNKETLKTYGQGTPNDWLEKHLYDGHSALGIKLMLVINYLLFGFAGIAIWAVQMAWIPLFAAGIINGVAHALGYRNFEIADDSTNLINIGLIIGGEELHNNHHAFPGSAKFSVKPWEFDIGWIYIKLLSYFGLASVKRTIPKISVPEKTNLIPTSLNMETVKILFLGRAHIMAEYLNSVMQPVLNSEIKKARQIGKHDIFKLLKSAKKPFLGHHTRVVHSSDQNILEKVLDMNRTMHTAYEFKTLLQELWQEHRNDHEKLRSALLEWCTKAEKSGLDVLEIFAMRLQKANI